ncbi:MAG: HBL/NHE enterotoxin family protein [Oscillospiraceae bacterium]
MEDYTCDNGQVILKTRIFGGFDKEQVLAAIERLREQNQAAQSELEARMEALSDARGALAEQVSGFEQQITELEQQLAGRSDRISELTGQIDTMQSEIFKKQQSQSEAERMLSAQKEQTRQLTLRAQSFEYKAKRYDDVAGQLGDIMLEARQNAGEVIASAEIESQNIKEGAIRVTERISDEMLSLKDDLTLIRKNVSDMMCAFDNRLDTIDRALDSIKMPPIQSQTDDAPAIEETVVQQTMIAEPVTEEIANDSATAVEFFRPAATM